MKFLVTGGAGFIGSHLTKTLLEQQHSVVCIDNLSTGSFQNILPYVGNPDYEFIQNSLEHCAVLEKQIAECDVVFHMAASVGVKNIMEHPIYCIENNVFCTSQILKWSDKYQKRVITFSTSEVYGKAQKFPFEEGDDIVLGPIHKLRWAYAASKLIDDYLARAYFIEKKTKVTIVRLFNTIGQRQVGHYGMVVPRFFEAAIHNRPLTVFGTGEQTRCFGDVRDVVRALMALIGCESSYGELINIGNDQEVSINQLAQAILKITNSQSAIQYMSYEKAYGESFEDMERRVPSHKKLQALVGFEFEHTLESTLLWIHTEMLQRKSVAEQSSTLDVEVQVPYQLNSVQMS